MDKELKALKRVSAAVVTVITLGMLIGEYFVVHSGVLV